MRNLGEVRQELDQRAPSSGPSVCAAQQPSKNRKRAVDLDPGDGVQVTQVPQLRDLCVIWAGWCCREGPIPKPRVMGGHVSHAIECGDPRSKVLRRGHPKVRRDLPALCDQQVVLAEPIGVRRWWLCRELRRQEIGSVMNERIARARPVRERRSKRNFKLLKPGNIEASTSKSDSWIT